jgi:hypothetical protein
MKFKVLIYDDSEHAYIIVDKRLALYLHATGCRTKRYLGDEPEAQRGRWAGEIQFGCREDADIFAANHIPRQAKEIEEVTKEVERKGE